MFQENFWTWDILKGNNNLPNACNIVEPNCDCAKFENKTAQKKYKNVDIVKCNRQTSTDIYDYLCFLYEKFNRLKGCSFFGCCNSSCPHIKTKSLAAKSKNKKAEKCINTENVSLEKSTLVDYDVYDDENIVNTNHHLTIKESSADLFTLKCICPSSITIKEVSLNESKDSCNFLDIILLSSKYSKENAVTVETQTSEIEVKNRADSCNLEECYGVDLFLFDNSMKPELLTVKELDQKDIKSNGEIKEATVKTCKLTQTCNLEPCRFHKDVSQERHFKNEKSKYLYIKSDTSNVSRKRTPNNNVFKKSQSFATWKHIDKDVSKSKGYVNHDLKILPNAVKHTKTYKNTTVKEAACTCSNTPLEGYSAKFDKDRHKTFTSKSYFRKNIRNEKRGKSKSPKQFLKTDKTTDSEVARENIRSDLSTHRRRDYGVQCDGICNFTNTLNNYLQTKKNTLQTYIEERSQYYTVHEKVKRVKEVAEKTYIEAKDFWKIVREDPFKWQIFKSSLFFLAGLKLFSDIARNMNLVKC